MKLFGQLAEKMAKAGKEGMFKTWMLEESDLIQGAARAYGERLVSERLVANKKLYKTLNKDLLW